MALPVTGVYEIRSTADANNVNGGGFNSARGGTDYTLQDAAQLTVTDITCTAASTTISSVTGGFTAAMVGNYVHLYTLTGTGALPGWYEITTFTDGNNVIVDRTPTDGINNITAGTCKVGGAMSLNSTLDDDLFETAVATNGSGGNIFYIQAGTYTLGEGVSLAKAGGTQAPIKIIGYNATRGDTPTGSNRPTITAGANAFTIGSNWDVYNLIVTTTTANGFTFGASSKVINCKAINKSTTVDRAGFLSNNSGLIFNSEGISYRGRGLQTTSAHSMYIGNWFHASKVGVNLTNTTSTTFLLNNIVSDNINALTVSAAMTGTLQIAGNTLYGSENKTGVGIDMITGVTNVRAWNNIIYGFVTGVAHADTQTVGYDDYNDYFNNTNDVSAAGQWQKGANDAAINPAFTSVAQLTGTTATTSGSVLTQSGGDFSTVVDGRDYLYLVSGTGITAGYYGITAHTTTTVTLDKAPGTNATADKVWQVTVNHNYLPTGNI